VQADVARPGLSQANLFNPQRVTLSGANGGGS
jgi:hypothetical protein